MEDLTFTSTEIHPPGSTVELATSCLVPFDEVPFSQFAGRKLELMKSSIADKGICTPIIVRPCQGNRYEILDGHYRVAAAKILNIPSVPADIRQELSDEDALKYISVYNSLGLHLKCGLDIYDSNYKDSDEYKELKHIRVAFFLENSDVQYIPEDCMFFDEYIEHYLLSDDEVAKTYKSKYRMGNPYKLSESECSDYAVALAIILESCNIDNIALVDEDTRIELEDKAGDLTERFSRRSSGYIYQLKKYLGIDLDSFDYDGLENKRQRAKILYLVHLLKEVTFPGVNVLKILGKPSMENVDNSFFNYQTVNGKYIGFFKREVEREIDVKLKIRFRKAARDIVDFWGEIMIDWREQLELFYNTYSCIPPAVAKIKSQLEEAYNTSVTQMLNFETANAPLETLYLKLVQHEYLGIVEDQLNILSIPYNTDYHVPLEYTEEMRKFVCNKIRKEEFDSFFSNENVCKIAKYVYLKDDVTAEERRKIRKSKEKVSRFLDFLHLADPFGEYGMMDDVTELLLISCLQSILSDDQSEVFKYRFHGYEGTKGNRKGNARTQAALKNDNRTYDALKVYWVHRVVDRDFANMGKIDVRKAELALNILCLKVSREILKAPNWNAMIKTHEICSRIIMNSRDMISMSIHQPYRVV